jgi:hypothetical protein
MAKFELILTTVFTGLERPEYLRSVILENNEEYSYYRDKSNNKLVVICENQPRNLPLVGIRFEEIKE